MGTVVTGANRKYRAHKVVYNDDLHTAELNRARTDFKLHSMICRFCCSFKWNMPHRDQFQFLCNEGHQLHYEYEVKMEAWSHVHPKKFARIAVFLATKGSH